MKHKVIKAREKMNLSQQDFGNMLGIAGKHARSKVFDWELGKTEPNKTAQLIIEYILMLDYVSNDLFLSFLKKRIGIENEFI